MTFILFDECHRYIFTVYKITLKGKNITNYLKLGVKIYKDKINRHKKEWLKKHYDLDDTFEELKQVDYYPGSTINFKVSKNSFHGVPKINQDCERMSIQMYIFK